MVVRIAVVDELEVVRAGLEAWFSAPPVICVGSFADPSEYLDWLPAAPRLDAVIAEVQWGQSAPDVHCIRRMSAAGPPVIVHSRLASFEVILTCLEAGAASYVIKSEGRSQLFDAVCSCRDNHFHIAPGMAEALHRNDTGGRARLSQREREVLTAWLRTDSKDDVGQSLHIAPATVRTHLQRIRAKYAETGRPAHTKAALFARAVEDGLIGLAELCQPNG